MSTFSLYSKRFTSWVLTMLLLVIIVSLTRNAWELWHLRSRVTDAEEEHLALEEEKARLEQFYQEQAAPFTMEREIRDKLHMSLPGEEVLVVPEELRQATSDQQPATSSNNSEKHEEMVNWKKWWRLVNP
jgi:hypothetical protein